MDLSFLLSSFAAPIAVGVGVGWISNRWSSSHGWLRAEVESRSKYYAEVLVSGQELREVLTRMYELAEFLRDYDPSGAAGELDSTLAETKTETEELANRTIATWRGHVKKAPLFAAAVVTTPIKASEDALVRMLVSFQQNDPLRTAHLRCQVLRLWTEAIERTIERDMVDLRLRAIRGLPRRQRRAEKMHLKETSASLEAEISEISHDISTATKELEAADPLDSDDE